MTLTGQFPSLEVIVSAALWSVANCPLSGHFLKASSCSQNGPRHCLGPVAWFGEHMPWKREYSPVNCKAVDEDKAPVWHSLNSWSLPSPWAEEQLKMWGEKTPAFQTAFVWFFFPLVIQLSACKPELHLLCTDWNLSPSNLHYRITVGLLPQPDWGVQHTQQDSGEMPDREYSQRICEIGVYLDIDIERNIQDKGIVGL